MKPDKVTYGAHIFLWIDRWKSDQIWLFEDQNLLGLMFLKLQLVMMWSSILF